MTQLDPQSEKAMLVARRRAFIGGAIGNGIEWYDFAIYGYLAIHIGRVFFAPGGETAQLLSAFAVFGLSFFARPLGGLVFGPLADKVGRKRVMVIVLTMMGAATFLIGVLPGYAQMGIAAPILLVVLRLLQGLSAGGEVGSTSTYMAEFSAAGRRGYGVSWMAFSCVLGIMLGGLLATGLGALLSSEAMASWGWRIPFLVAGPLGLVGLFIRMKLEDTPDFTSLERSEQLEARPIRRVLQHRRQLVTVAGIATLYGVSFYMVFTYLSTYISTIVGLGSGVALLAVLLGGCAALVLLPVTGALSDRIGRRPVLAGAAGGFLILGIPLFHLIASGGVAGAIIGTVLLAALQATFLATALVTMTEVFPAEIRTTGVSLGLNVPIAIFGGTAPFIATLLISQTGVMTSPSWYLVAAALLTLGALTLLRTSPTATPARSEPGRATTQ